MAEDTLTTDEVLEKIEEEKAQAMQPFEIRIGLLNAVKKALENKSQIRPEEFTSYAKRFCGDFRMWKEYDSGKTICQNCSLYYEDMVPIDWPMCRKMEFPPHFYKSVESKMILFK